MGEARAVGGRRGFERLLESSVPHSYPSPGPCASASWKLRRLFVKRGRGSLALTRPRSCLRCPQGVTAPRPDPPRANLLLWLQRQLLLPPTRREPHGPQDARSRPRPATLLPLRPLRCHRRRRRRHRLLARCWWRGEGNKTGHAQCGERGPKGGAWSTAPGRRRGLWALGLPDTSQTPQSLTAWMRSVYGPYREWVWEWRKS